MNPAEWDWVQDLFVQASDLPRESRASFLNLHCRADDTIRRQVEAMLTADEASDERLRAIVSAAALEMQMDEAAQAVGSRIGPYVIEREIGHGGMGTVYLAFRDDDQFRQRVAIKVVNRGMDSEFAVTRFRRERQVLADLQHPNIARLLDGGATDDGLPFFAMEYLEGDSLTAYCGRKGLDARARLHLFLQVCAAVQYAHGMLVIHGDLKPGNILVGEDGSPKLLDFGIATLIGVHSGAAESHSPITARYASPEQLQGKALTTATDIYSLGALLRELLAGALSGDPESIVKAAMRQNADCRYASVEELAQDIRRYLEIRPVRARGNSPWRRGAKFVRRRWLPLLAAGVAVASLAGGLAMAITKAREAEAARALAEDRLTRIVGASNRSLSDVGFMLERLPGAISARRELIGATLEFLSSLAKDAGGDARLRLVLAKGYSRLGMLQGGPDSANLGDVEGAVKSYRAGLALLEGPVLAGMPGERLPVWLELQRRIAMLLTNRENPSAAAAILEALAVAARAPPALLANKDVARSRAGLYLALARAHHDDPPRAAVYAVQALDALAAIAKQYPADADTMYNLSTAHTELGFLLWNRAAGDPEAAAAHYAESMRIRERLVETHPADDLYRRSLILAYEHFGSMQGGRLVASMGKPETARIYYKKAIAIAESVAADPQDSLAAEDYATLLVRYAALDAPPGGLAESLATLRRAIAILETLIVRDDSGLRYDNILATAHDYAGRRLTAMGKYAEAIEHHQRALSLAAVILKSHPNDPDTVQQSFDAESGMVRALALEGDRAGSLQRANALVQSAEQVAGHAENDPFRQTLIAQAYVSLAAANVAFRQCAPARDAAQQAIRRVRPLLTGHGWDSNDVLFHEAQTLLAQCAGRADAN